MEQNNTMEDNNRSYNTYLTILSIILVHRYPDIRSEELEEDTLREITEFAFRVARVGEDVWSERMRTERRRIPSTRRSAA